MKKTICKFSFLIFFIAFSFTSAYAQLMGDLFPTDGSNNKSGPTEITSNSMDINLEGNTITLYGNVVVNDKQTNITADKIIVYLTNVKTKGSKKNKEGQIESETKKEAKELVATGHVIIIKKTDPDDKTEKSKEEKATAGKADYNVKTGVIVLTEDPILFQGGSYIRGEKITLFRNSNRVIVEGNQYVGQSSKLIYNPKSQ